jgi:hypothetical protein
MYKPTKILLVTTFLTGILSNVSAESNIDDIIHNSHKYAFNQNSLYTKLINSFPFKTYKQLEDNARLEVKFKGVSFRPTIKGRLTKLDLEYVGVTANITFQ